MDGDDLSSGPASPAVLDDPDAPVESAESASEDTIWTPAASVEPDEQIPWWWPTTKYPGDELAHEWLRKAFSFLIVAGCCGFVFWICQPSLIFHKSLPTGGDMGAHVWGPAYLRDYLLPHFRLSGWTPDWLGGFPAYSFYMVLPSLAVVILNVGLLPAWAMPIAVVAFGALGLLIHRRLTGRVVRCLAFTACTLAFFLSFKIPYDVSFKLVAVSGLVFFPAAIWYLGKGLALRQPVPELMAIASLMFLMDKTLFSIFGGNIASTMAGEFAFSISLTVGVFFLGVVARGIRTGRHRALGGALLAVTLLCHVIPSIYVIVGTLIMVALRIRWIEALKRRFGRAATGEGADVAARRSIEVEEPLGVGAPAGAGGAAETNGHLEAGPAVDPNGVVGAADEDDFRIGSPGFVGGLKRLWGRLPLSIRWVVPVGFTGGLIAAFWYIPFYGFSAFLDDMGWSKYGLVANTAGVKRPNLHEFMGFLFPFAPHRTIPGGQLTAAEPDMLHGHFIFALAMIGIVLSFALMVRSGIFFTLFGVAAALGFWLMPQDRFWNARILPLYFLCVYMMAAIGVWLLIRVIPLLLDADWGHPPRWVGAVFVGLAAVSGFWLVGRNHQWNLWAQILIYFCVFALAAVGVFLVGRPTTDVSWGHPMVWVGIGLIGVALVLGYGLMPKAHAWGDQRQFVYYAVEFIIGALGAGLVVRFVAPGPSRQPAPWVGISVTTVAAVAILGVMLMSIRFMPGGNITTDAKGVTTYNWGPIHTKYNGPVRDWVAWNFTGYEGKGAAWTELDGIKNTMGQIGQQEGCGRAYWEYSPDLNRFGSPMALMLLPYWTHSCIGSMEGLYMESSSTTPFHFTVQGELSQQCSCAQLWDIFGVNSGDVYKGVQFDLGVKHLQMLGVRYFMASSATIKGDAAKDPRLKKLASSGAFDIYQVKGAPLAEGLDTLPAVWKDVKNPIHSWAKPAEEWFIDPSQWGVYRAEDGPASWPRITSKTPADKVPVKPVKAAKVTNIQATRDTISFDVDHVGTPVLVKTSYFPDWQTSDGAGPYRVAPNLMVVVPTSKHVVLTYGRSPLELGSWALTFVGLGLLLWMVRSGSPDEKDQGEFVGDLDEDGPDRTRRGDGEGEDVEDPADDPAEAGLDDDPYPDPDLDPDHPDGVPSGEPVADPEGVPLAEPVAEPVGGPTLSG